MEPGWPPADYTAILDLPAGHAAEASLQLTRPLVARLDEVLAALAAATVPAGAPDPLAYDAAAGVALHAGRPEVARELVEVALVEIALGGTALPPVVEALLRVKGFAAACVLADADGAQEDGAWLLAYAERHGDAAIAAIVWSGRAVACAVAGDPAGVAQCRAAYDALPIPPELETTREGTASLVALAEATLAGPPATVAEPWAVSLLDQAPPMIALARHARAVGRPLVAPARVQRVTERRERVLDQLAAGATNAQISRSLGVAPRTVQADVTALKRIFGVTNRAGLVTAARRVAGSDARVAGSDVLTGRQRVVAELVAQGFTNRGVAARLGISERTVERHLADACQRLGVVGRTALAAAVGERPAPGAAPKPEEAPMSAPGGTVVS